jgi:hypothetical protein
MCGGQIAQRSKHAEIRLRRGQVAWRSKGTEDQLRERKDGGSSRCAEVRTHLPPDRLAEVVYATESQRLGHERADDAEHRPARVQQLRLAQPHLRHRPQA